MAKIEATGFNPYTPKALPKVNSMRMANSLVQITGPIPLEKGQVLFSPGVDNPNPRNCYSCNLYNETAQTCQIIRPEIRVKKFVYPPEGGKKIEYWPVCGMWKYGETNKGTATYEKPQDPDNLGFGFVNAPKVGLTQSGTNCGGGNNGDDCDNYRVTGDRPIREYPVGFCRVLQTEVSNLDCCSAWIDDDWVDWQKGQALMKDLEETKTPNPFMGRG